MSVKLAYGSVVSRGYPSVYYRMMEVYGNEGFGNVPYFMTYNYRKIWYEPQLPVFLVGFIATAQEILCSSSFYSVQQCTVYHSMSLEMSTMIVEDIYLCFTSRAPSLCNSHLQKCDKNTH